MTAQELQAIFRVFLNEQEAGVDKVCHVTGLSPPTVIAGLKKLVEAELIEERVDHLCYKSTTD